MAPETGKGALYQGLAAAPSGLGSPSQPSAFRVREVRVLDCPLGERDVWDWERN